MDERFGFMRMKCGAALEYWKKGDALRRKKGGTHKASLMAENPICGMYQRMTAEGSGNMEIIFINKVHMQMEMKQYAPNDNI